MFVSIYSDNNLGSMPGISYIVNWIITKRIYNMQYEQLLNYAETQKEYNDFKFT